MLKRTPLHFIMLSTKFFCQIVRGVHRRRGWVGGAAAVRSLFLLPD